MSCVNYQNDKELRVIVEEKLSTSESLEEEYQDCIENSSNALIYIEIDTSINQILAELEPLNGLHSKHTAPVIMLIRENRAYTLRELLSEYKSSAKVNLIG